MDSQTLNAIKKFALEQYSQARDKRHDISHIERVRNNALAITNILEVERLIDKNLLEAACYLHDVIMLMDKGGLVSALYYHFFERMLNRKYLPLIIKQFNLSASESRVLTETVINHPHSLPYHVLNKHKDPYSQILQDADSLDYISRARQINFCAGKNKILTYLVHWYLSFLRKRIKYYLNFPELAAKMVL